MVLSIAGRVFLKKITGRVSLQIFVILVLSYILEESKEILGIEVNSSDIYSDFLNVLTRGLQALTVT